MKCVFESLFSEHIIGLIQQKRADGLIYDEYRLKKLDEFFASRFPLANRITRDIAAEWSEIRPTEGAIYRRCRVNLLRQLSLYMLSLGFEAYVPRNIGKTPKPYTFA